MPDGWQLVAERDVEESPNGRWERTFAQSAGESREQSLVLYQSLAGPVNVTGGTENTSVTVNGRPATLYRFPPTGDLVLMWVLNENGLALVGYESAFTVDELIALAESAR